MTRDDFFTAISQARPISFSAEADDAARSIDASWVKQAMKVAENVIDVERGLIIGELEVDNCEILAKLRMRDCQFAIIRIRYCVTANVLDLSNSTITALDLRGTTFARSLWLRKVLINSFLDLGYARVNTELDLDGATIQGKLYAYGLSVEQNIHMRDVTVAGMTDMSRVSASGQVDLARSFFQNEFAMRDSSVGAFATDGVTFTDVQLERTRVASSMFFYAKSTKALNCHSINVHGQLVIKGTSVSGPACFEAAKCLDLVFRKCEFQDSLSAIGAEVFILDAAECQFRKDLNLNDVRCDSGIGFTDCEIDTLHLERAKVGGSLSIVARKLAQIRVGNLICFGTVIGAQLILERIRIDGKLVLESASIGADVQLTDGVVCEGLLAMGAKVGGSFSFEKSLCGGPAEFTAMTIGEQLILIDSEFLGDVRLWGIQVRYFVDLRRAIFEYGLSFAHASLPNQVILYDIISGGPLSFQDAKVGALFFDRKFTDKGDENSWPFYLTSVDMAGCQYERISVVWTNFVQSLVAQADGRADRQPFAQLEKFMRSIGRDDWADSVYFQGRRALGNRMRPSVELVLDRLGRFMSGYGVRPFRLLACVAVIYFGLVLLYSAPGVARPTSVAPAMYHCNLAPDLPDRLGLAVVSMVPGGTKVLDGWTISDCPLFASALPVGKPFIWLGVAQLFSLILIPFLVSTLTRLLKYEFRRD